MSRRIFAVEDRVYRLAPTIGALLALGLVLPVMACASWWGHRWVSTTPGLALSRFLTVSYLLAGAPLLLIGWGAARQAMQVDTVRAAQKRAFAVLVVGLVGTQWMLGMALSTLDDNWERFVLQTLLAVFVALLATPLWGWMRKRPIASRIALTDPLLHERRADGEPA